jgi:hypothetical protein
MTIPLAILAWGKSALSRIWSAITANPWPSACIALALLSVWLWHGKADYRDRLSTEQTGRKADRADYDRKFAAAQAVAAKARKDAQEIAGEADKTHDALLADNAGLERYIADHRVRAKACAADSARAGSGQAAGVSAQSAALPRVEVSSDALKVCDADYAYARSAYDWGQDLMVKGLAEK